VTKSRDIASLSPLLTVTETIGHSWRVRSVTTLVGVLTDKVGRFLTGPRWGKAAYWYAGRLLGSKPLSDGRRLQLNPDTPAYLAGTLWLGLYEQKERYAVARFLPRDRPVIEFGAGIGAVTCMTNRLLRRPDQHCAVEANPVAVPTLIANRKATNGSFSVVHGALAYDSSVAHLKFDPQMIFGALSDRGVEVPAVTLRQVLDKTGFTACSLVCDIEGAEFTLLEREADVIERHVEFALMEIHPQFTNNIERFWAKWREMNYQCTQVKTGVWMFRRLGLAE
jgi:FkbM family methyltransferase